MNALAPFRITEPGIYDLAADVYHSDPCPVPSLSRSIAHKLIRQTPLHAHYEHPRLGGNGGIIPTRAMDDGSAVHSMLLGKGADLVPLAAVYGTKHELAGKPVRDFKTKAAEDERDAIRRAGGIPIIAHRVPMLENTVRTVFDQMHTHPDCVDFFGPGRSEAVVIWREGDLWFRIMVDRLPEDPHAPPYDLKTTELSAAPGGWERRLQSEYAFQDAFYRRGLKAVRGIYPEAMRFVVPELKPPHAMAVMCAAPSLQAIAEAEVDRAIRIWGHCMKTSQWPGYPPFTAHVEAPNWMLMRAEEQAMRDEFIQENAA